MSLYDALGVDKNATTQEVRRAYRREAKRAHPDQGGQAEKFMALARAYAVLKDPKARAHYDATGEAPPNQNERQQMAVKTLVEIFTALLRESVMQGTYQTVDLIGTLRDRLQLTRRELDLKRKNSAAVSDKFAECLERLARAKPGEDDPLRTAIQAEAEQARAISINLATALEVQAEVEALCEGYAWRVDVADVVSLGSWSDSGTVSSSARNLWG